MRDPLIIQPGTLRHAIEIRKPSTAGDTLGKTITPAAWPLVRSTRAAIATAGGRETSQAEQLVSNVSHVVTIRYSADVIRAGYRVIFAGRILTIQYVENVLERNRVLLLYCLEVNGQAAA